MSTLTLHLPEDLSSRRQLNRETVSGNAGGSKHSAVLPAEDHLGRHVVRRTSEAGTPYEEGSGLQGTLSGSSFVFRVTSRVVLPHSILILSPSS